MCYIQSGIVVTVIVLGLTVVMPTKLLFPKSSVNVPVFTF